MNFFDRVSMYVSQAHFLNLYMAQEVNRTEQKKWEASRRNWSFLKINLKQTRFFCKYFYLCNWNAFEWMRMRRMNCQHPTHFHILWWYRMKWFSWRCCWFLYFKLRLKVKRFWIFKGFKNLFLELQFKFNLFSWSSALILWCCFKAWI